MSGAPDTALEFCYKLYTYWPFEGSDVVGNPSFFCTMHAGFQFICFVYIMFFIWRNRRRAAKGDMNEADASETIIFPFHQILVGIMAYACVQQTIFDLFVPVTGEHHPVWASYLLGFGLAFTSAVTESVAFLLCFHGVGQRAIRYTVVFFVCYLMLGTGILGWAWTLPADDVWRPGANLVCVSISMVYHGIIWLTPSNILYRRPAVKNYSMFWTLANFLLVLSQIFRIVGYNVGYCIYEVSTHGLLSITVPYCVYKTLLADSRYWLGLSEATPSGIAEPLLGFQLGPSSARELAQEIDAPTFGCHKVVRAINFAFLSLEKNLDSTTSQKYRHVVLGAGSTSRVFRGRYKMKPVAIKMIFCFDLTPEVVSNFYREASFLARLQHPNIVRVEGVSVNPPAICLVLELCATNMMDFLESAYRGVPLDEYSLATGGVEVYDSSNRLIAGKSSESHSGEYAGNKSADADQPGTARDSAYPASPSNSASPFPASPYPTPKTGVNLDETPYYTGRPISYTLGRGLSWTTKIRMMMDCCRAVMYLHTQHPPVLHLDIKSSNFLIGSDGLVKLADLELSRQAYAAPVNELSKQAQEVPVAAGGSKRKRKKSRRRAQSQPQDDPVLSPRRTPLTVFSGNVDRDVEFKSLEEAEHEALYMHPEDEESDHYEDNSSDEAEQLEGSGVITSDGLPDRMSRNSSYNASIQSSSPNGSLRGGSSPSLERRSSRGSSIAAPSSPSVSFEAAAAAAATAEYRPPTYVPPPKPSSSGSLGGDVMISLDGASSTGATYNSDPSARMSTGSSNRSDEGQTSVPALRSPLMGIRLPERINWLAPEIIMGQSYDEKADVYSLTCVLWEILTGNVPYTDLEEKVKEYLSLPQLPKAKPQSLLSGYSTDRQAAEDGTFVFNTPTGLNTYINTTTATPVGPTPPEVASPSSKVRVNLGSGPSNLDLAKMAEDSEEEGVAAAPTMSDVLEDLRPRSNQGDDERSSTGLAPGSDREGDDKEPDAAKDHPSRSTASQADSDLTLERGYSAASNASDAKPSRAGFKSQSAVFSTFTPGLIKSSSFDGKTPAEPKPRKQGTPNTKGVKIADEVVSVTVDSQPNAESGLLNLNRKPTQGILRNSAKYHTIVTAPHVVDDDREHLSLQQRAEETRKKHLQKLRASNPRPSQQQVFSAMRHMICVQHYRPTIPSNTPPLLKKLLQQGWAPDPRDRPTCAEMLAVLARLDARLQATLSSQLVTTSSSSSSSWSPVRPSRDLTPL